MKRVLALLLLALGAREASPADYSPLRSRIDLLGIIDVSKDARQGEWRFVGRALATPSGAFDRLELPYALPAEYDLELVVERKEGTNSLNLGLACGEARFMLIVDGWDAPVTGLEILDGRPFFNNETTVAGPLLPPGGRRTIVCSVRRERVVVTLDGRRIIDWKADYPAARMYEEWEAARTDTLLVGSWRSVFHVHRLEVTPVKGAGRRLR
ncbi:MAG: hypothetical protein HYY16_19490 [Planctomycetes bacterium]|nr:hypothetical protein [Planctomycetota bacterium]